MYALFKSTSMFEKPFSFKGRIRRAEYFISFVLYFFFIAMVYLNMLLFGSWVLILLVGLIPLSWFLLAQGTKRCHDLGHSGFFQYIPFYRLVLLFSEGQKGENEYGPNPKEAENKSRYY